MLARLAVRIVLLSAVFAAEASHKSLPPKCIEADPAPPNRTLHVLYCDTRLGHRLQYYKNESAALRVERSSPLQFEVINVCFRVRWDGFKTKPIQYLKYLRGLIRRLNDEGIAESEVAVMLADSDTFWSTDSVSSVFRKYDCVRQNKSLVMSTESSCWIGRICTQEDIQRYYGHASSPSYSSFINSGLSMGSPSALVHLLEYVVSSNASLINGKLDDQLGYASYFATFPSLVALDYHQELFGSLAFAVKINDENTSSLTCEIAAKTELRAQPAFLHKIDCDRVDSARALPKKFHVQNTNCSIVRYRNPARSSIASPFAFNCVSLIKEVYSKGGIYLENELCKVMRRPIYNDANIDSRTDRATQEVMDTLSSDPVIWHGNGFSKSTLLSLRSELSRCLFHLRLALDY